MWRFVGGLNRVGLMGLRGLIRRLLGFMESSKAY
jgi:hypothetical protein